MAMAKPVVVSRTRAIASGYGLADGVNCRLVEPGDAGQLERAILDLLADEAAASALGARARETVGGGLSRNAYAEALWRVLSTAAVAEPASV
jgi:glycosyltransferase involved in cell wall biosynthesis